MSSYADRLAALREQLKADRLDGFVVPLTDEHMSEYVGSYAQRLAWLTGFDGSAGAAVVLPDDGVLAVGLAVRSSGDDGRGARWERRVAFRTVDGGARVELLRPGHAWARVDGRWVPDAVGSPVEEVGRAG